ncbi:amino acid adenylation domain-containing protein [Streptomyces sp. NBC_01201]|uniref:non-ribosomal peptide synthetase n=1 Tax=unclassified Streptomyces TaxID=2593676 RepID=UPI002E0EAC3A|nr:MULTISPECIES: amino acid adenylation domain-containing protein [unclassified Streptomyces]WSR07440.1 amino acid adenylation domain-containing protein [Streptomyces sp. NBC_01208]WSR49806.1 amino acid adenylation domain-containing protein [Streptomyces sp. NBC_01201]
MTCADLAVSVLGEGTDPADFATDSFIALGGDSLRAMRLAALAEEQLGLRIAAAALLSETPLATVLSGAEPVTGTDGEPAAADVSDDGALSPAQRGMWLIESLAGGSPYNLVFTCFVEDGTLDRDYLAKALAETTGRHEGLRTVFRETDSDVVREVLSAHVPELTTYVYDGPAAGFEEYVRDEGARQGRRPFDLSAAPAYRWLHFSRPGGGEAVVLAAHHMVLDGWAVGLLLTEVFARYGALADGAAEPDLGPDVPVGVLARRQEALRATGVWDSQAELWKRHLDGVPRVLELPADRQRPAVQDATGGRSALDLGPGTTAAVAGRARELGITPYAFLLGAFGLTLSRRTGSRSLLVGVPLLGRGFSELEHLVAVTGNLVPVRVDVDDEATAAGYLRSVHASLGRSIDAGDLPFEELVARVGVERGLGCHPLVQVCFGMHDQLVPQGLDAGSVRLRVEEGHGGGSQFDLTMLIGHADPSFSGHVEYATSVWTEDETRAFVADFRAAVEQLATDPAARLEDVRCVSAASRARLDGINTAADDFPDSSLDALFREVAARTPDAVAVRDEASALTYARLADAAAEQARLLREAGVGPGDRVLVGVDRSVAEAVAVLGVQWAGAAYVGVEQGVTDAHLARIVARAAPAAVLAGPVSGPAAARAAALGVRPVATWEPSWPAATEGGAAPFAPEDPARLAYVAFTSGSTGEPKGVSVPHRAVIRLVHEAGFVRLGPGERMLRLSPLAFDASTLELWGALLTGATLEVHPPGLASPTELGAFLRERGITVAWLTAGLFRLVEEFAPDSFAGVRQLLTGGDVVPHDHVARALTRHPGLVVTNGYGPTENTTFTTTHSVERPEDVDGPLPIGTPVPGTHVYVLDERRRVVPAGAVGELYAGGAGLADGYLGDEAGTARSFGTFSPDVGERLYRTGDVVRMDGLGRLRFLGRADDQVKLRGYRVELGAIGDVLTAHPGVLDAVVHVTDGDSAEKRLVASVVLTPGGGTDAVALRALLKERLPAYMVPSLWAVVDRLPLTVNGKVDLRALAARAVPAARAGRPVAGAGAGTVAAPVETEQTAPGPAEEPTPSLSERIAELFTAVIEDPEAAVAVTGDTDFFMVGGNSLGAVRLMRRLKAELGVSVRLRDFLLAPTPDGLRALVEKAGAE